MPDANRQDALPDGTLSQSTVSARNQCQWPTGEHFWSIPQRDGAQTCLWCPAIQRPEPVEHDDAR